MSGHSEDAIKVLNTLSDEEKKTIRHDNPFRNERNDKIIELSKRGVKGVILAEITGLSDNAISDIIRRKRKHHQRSKNA